MTFNIYSNYKVHVINTYSYYNEEGDIVEETEEFVKEFDGGKLAEFIAECLNDRYFSSTQFGDNTTLISTFNPMDGTGADISISIIVEAE